ncbi:AMP-binding protein [Streptomyces sp. NPDC050658]|uniref:AMP-binding protein n=1 Tax=unclassified Streptomyces TaxID=2593676 RepID=UPI003442388B
MTQPNLLTRVYAAARRRGDGPGVRFLKYGSPDVALPYEDFLLKGAWLGGELPQTAQGDPGAVVIAANDPMATLLAFFAALSTGRPPLVLPGPAAAGGMPAFHDRIQHMSDRFAGSCVLAVEEGLVPDGATPSGVPVLPLPTDLSAYKTAPVESLGRNRSLGGDRLAFLQMTSGSTGDSRLVAITHANACANLASLRAGLGAGNDERMGSWLPLYHDMGLVGTALLSFVFGWPLYLMKPTDFIMRPHRWINALSEHRCTVTAAPNFGYDYAWRRIRDQEIAGCDLAALRRAAVGAEPIRPATVSGFEERFRDHGLRPGRVVPSYGMAETTVGATMVPPGKPARCLFVDVAHTETGSPVRILGEEIIGSGSTRGLPDAPNLGATPVLSVGPPLPGMEVVVTDDEGNRLTEDGILGEVAVRGPSVSAGYLDPVTHRPVPFPGGWHRTGDLGLLRKGELYILERRKHVIIRNGRNYLASLLEERVAHFLAHSPHEIMVLDTDIHDPDSAIVALVENYSGTACLSHEQMTAFKELDLPLESLLFTRKRTIPRTTSGKKKYDQARRQLGEHAAWADQVLQLGGSPPRGSA